MSIGTSKRLQKLKQETSTKPSFQIRDNELKLVGNIKCLGVQVGQNLNWNPHVANACEKVLKGIEMKYI